MTENDQEQKSWKDVTVDQTFNYVRMMAVCEAVHIAHSDYACETEEEVIHAAYHSFLERQDKLDAYRILLAEVYVRYPLFTSTDSPFKEEKVERMIQKYLNNSVSLTLLKLERILIDMFHILNESMFKEQQALAEQAKGSVVRIDAFRKK